MDDGTKTESSKNDKTMKNNVLIINTEADWFVEQLQDQFPTLNFQAVSSPDLPIKEIENTEILIGIAPQLSDALIAKMPKLRWIHGLTTGVDNLLGSKTLGTDVALSNSSGFHGPQMSELAILLMLSSTRQFPRMLQNQQNKKWERWPQPLLQGKTACIIGLGAIAMHLATVCTTFGMELTGVSDGRDSVPGFSRVYKRRDLDKAAAEADYLIVLVPYEKSTHHIVNDHVLQCMQTHSILINLSRGGCVDEMAVQQHLQDKSIQAAALDVFAEEPLGEHSTLWHTDGLTITPHIGGMSDIYHKQVLPSVVANLSSWTKSAAKHLPNKVERV